MRIIITGAEGFVGQHVVTALKHSFGTRAELVLTSLTLKSGSTSAAFVPLDITEPAAVEGLIAKVTPTHIVHLAGIAAPADAARDPDTAWRVNLHGTLNIARALMKTAPQAGLVFAGSGLAYGLTSKCGAALDETALFAPADEYGATKAAADLALGAFAARGLKVLRFRPFNHTGPGQSESYVVPGFAMQIARIEAGQLAPVIRVGNLDAKRDFLDVRDVASAYARGVDCIATMEPGTILNLASGVPRRIGDILEVLLGLSQTRIAVEQDPTRMHASDLPCITGNAARARELLSWTPQVPFDVTLAEVLSDCRARLRSQ